MLEKCTTYTTLLGNTSSHLFDAIAPNEKTHTRCIWVELLVGTKNYTDSVQLPRVNVYIVLNC